MTAEVTEQVAKVLFKDYDQVAFGLFCVLATYTIIIFTCTLPARFTTFSTNYMEDFNSMHRHETGEKRAPDFGFPDCGAGRFAKLLPYKDWYKLNCGQRCQINFHEQLSSILICGAITGIVYPRHTVHLLLTYCIARLLYSIGYMYSPKMRVPGAILQDVVLFYMFYLTAKCGWEIL